MNFARNIVADQSLPISARIKKALRDKTAGSSILASIMPESSAGLLFSKWSELKNAVLPEPAKVLVLGFSDKTSREIFGILLSSWAWSCTKSADVSTLGDLAEGLNDFSHVIVNLDAFADVQAAVVALMAFRHKMPKVVVILISKNVQGDDLGSERRLICDVTLRAPVSRERLTQALSSANQNNAAFNRADKNIASTRQPVLHAYA